MTPTARQEMAGHLAACHRVVLTTHQSPDGDGIGSEVALALLLRSAGTEVRVVNADPLPRLLQFLGEEIEVETYAPSVHDGLLAAADAIVMLDNSVPARMAAMEPSVRRSPAKKLCIDHHPDPDPYWEASLIDVGASCTGELIFDLAAEMELELDAAGASAIYTALVSDTGRFRFANTTARALEIASRLVAAGAQPTRIYGLLEEQHSEGFLRLYGEVLSRMESRCGGRLLLLRIPRALIEAHAAEQEDLSEIINQSLGHRESRLAALFRELDPSRTKVSLRSKGERNVNRLARRHGGGGHANASGIVLDLSLEQAVTHLLGELEALARE